MRTATGSVAGERRKSMTTWMPVTICRHPQCETGCVDCLNVYLHRHAARVLIARTLGRTVDARVASVLPFTRRSFSERTGSVSEPTREQVRTAWRKMAARYNWRLAVDVESVVDRVQVEWSELRKPVEFDSRLRKAVQRVYAAEMYAGLQRRDDDAAAELWMILVRFAKKRGFREEVAAELAQDAIYRVLKTLANVRKPQALIDFAAMALLTAIRNWKRRFERDEPWPVDEDGNPLDPSDPMDAFGAVEDAMNRSAVVDLLRQHLPSERQVLVLYYLFFEDWSQTAISERLGIQGYQVRMAKCRALQRLRAKPQVLLELEELAGLRKSPEAHNPDLAQDPTRDGENDDV
jgi:RNA polymerase sigma factor (sigma-70 family)